MYLSELRLRDFRSYESADLELGQGTTVFLGPNGYGKTNLVEAVQYLATLGSHRVGSDQPLVRSGCDVATIAAKVHAGRDDDRTLSVAVDIKLGAPNRALLNKAAVRPRQILGAVRTVFFAPEDLAIVRGDPAERRGFIDELITSRWPRLAGVRSEYDRALRQKTALLKAISGRSVRSAGAGAEETIGVWDETMITLGAEIVAARLRTLADLVPLVASHYGAIAPVNATARLAYQSSSVDPEVGSEVDQVRQALAGQMQARHGDELARGICLVGPHRDDIACFLGDLPVRGYASHGEGWSYALALRLASVDLLRQDGVEPVLILDDVFAELDEHRRARMVAASQSVEQTLVTAAVPADLPPNFAAAVFQVEPGRVHPAEGRTGANPGGPGMARPNPQPAPETTADPGAGMTSYHNEYLCSTDANPGSAGMTGGDDGEN